jgi:hypothetical protein
VAFFLSGKLLAFGAKEAFVFVDGKIAKNHF